MIFRWGGLVLGEDPTVVTEYIEDLSMSAGGTRCDVDDPAYGLVVVSYGFG